MKFVFWLSAIILFHTYAGYPLLALLIARVRARRVHRAPYTGAFSIVIAARNEEVNLRRKLPQLRKFLPRSAQLIVVDDGSTDQTSKVVSEIFPEATLIRLSSRLGKAAALTCGLQAASGDIIIFMDARQQLEADAINRLLEPFSDPHVGAVSGALIISGNKTPGERLKMGLENAVRAAEGKSGSVMGVTGAFYAARRDLIDPIPAGTLLDDLFVPFSVMRKGFRVVFSEFAYAYDDLAPTRSGELKRKIRTLTGNYQLLTLQPWLLKPWNGIFFRFVSHKLLRLLSPFCVVSAFLSAPFTNRAVFVLFLIGAGTLLIFSLLNLVHVPIRRLRQFSDFAMTFVVLNVAAAVAPINFLRGRFDLWAK
jgi:cellulose synthase/poly-beta-1,6-N-acetylglucosamine synthase-like glycosyltransferase